MRKTRIYVAFASSGLFGSTQTFPIHHPDVKVLTNEELLAEVRARCPDVEFVGTTRVENPAYVVANVQAQMPGLDGLLYFGHILPPGLEQIDLPILLVFPLWGQWQAPFHLYKGSRVLTATLPIIADVSADMFASRLQGIAEKIKLMQVAARMKGQRILCVTDRPILGAYEPTDEQMAKEGRPAYELKYLENLAELGAGIVVRPQEELVTRMETIPEAEASEVAHKWMAGAESIMGTNETQIKRSAKLYLVMKQMMQEYEADSITTEGYGVFMAYKNGGIPSQGLPSSQFCTDGVVATSETLLDSLVTQQLGLWVTGSTGFNGDYVIDAENHKIYIGHCECPWNPYGDDRKVPYVIRNLPQWPADKQEEGGACVLVRLPANELVTVAKLSVHDKKLSVFTGRTVAGAELFPGWDDILCRTKVAIDVDAAKVLENVDWWTFGNHRVVFYGDHRQRFKDLATFLGYETVEKDK